MEICMQEGTGEWVNGNKWHGKGNEEAAWSA